MNIFYSGCIVEILAEYSDRARRRNKELDGCEEKMEKFEGSLFLWGGRRGRMPEPSRNILPGKIKKM